MGDFTLEELQRRVEEQRERQLKKLKDNYQLARDLGFSPAEAQIMRAKSEDDIRQLAEEKAKQVINAQPNT